MATYQSVQSAAANGDSLVITKPTSLAVGDLMLAGIYSSNGTSANSVSINTPAGWTQQAIDGLSSSNSMIACFSKVADAGDVAASNFTFTDTNAAADSFMIGHILRLTNSAIADVVNTNESAASTTVVVSTITPTFPNSLFVIFAGADDLTTPPTVSTYAMATDDPTWTERAETSHTSAGGHDGVLAVATATRAATTATGNTTITFGTTPTIGGAIVIAMPPQNSGSISQATTINTYAFSPIPKTEIEAVAENPTTDSQTTPAWTNPNKPSTTWINTDKYS